MKLRIRGNSLRLRLNQQELTQLAETGRVEDQIQFGPREENGLRYSLTSQSQDARLRAEISSGHIQVYARTDDVQRLAQTEEVGLEDVQDLTDNNQLRLLVEKDFACLQKRPGEEDAHAFANPQQGQAC
ncbi:MAG: hypothetical protein M3Y13_08575 [Armatimonadota bacterium]|nr:hypothetical protein [Armatimonadota bacterium]